MKKNNIFFIFALLFPATCTAMENPSIENITFEKREPEAEKQTTLKVMTQRQKRCLVRFKTIGVLDRSDSEMKEIGLKSLESQSDSIWLFLSIDSMDSHQNTHKEDTQEKPNDWRWEDDFDGIEEAFTRYLPKSWFKK